MLLYGGCDRVNSRCDPHGGRDGRDCVHDHDHDCAHGHDYDGYAFNPYHSNGLHSTLSFF